MERLSLFLLLFFLNNVFTSEDESKVKLDSSPLVKNGSVVIGVFVNLHKDGDGESCNKVSIEGVEEVGALEWAISTINNQSSGELSIGLHIYDTCGGKDVYAERAAQLLEDDSYLIGVISLASYNSVLPALQGLGLPLLSASPIDDLTSGNVFVTSPKLESHMQAVLEASLHIIRSTNSQSRRVGLVSSCQRAAKILQELALKAHLTIHHRMDVHAGYANATIGRVVQKFALNKLGYGGILVLVLQTQEFNDLLLQLDPAVLRKAKFQVVLTSLNGESALSRNTIDHLVNVLQNSIVVLPHAPLITGFTKAFISSVKANTSIVSGLVNGYLQERDECPKTNTPILSSNIFSLILGYGFFSWLFVSAVSYFPVVVAGGLEEGSTDVEDLVSLIKGVKTTSAVKAVSSLAAALTLVQIQHCSAGTPCELPPKDEFKKDMLSAMLKLSVKIDDGPDRLRYTSDGRLLTTFFVMRTENLGLYKIGSYRDDTGMIWSLKASIKYDDRFGRALPLKQRISGNSVEVKPSGSIQSVVISDEIFGGILLFGVMGIYSSCILFILPSGELVCRLRQWMPMVFLALCYGVLLIKSMHLRGLVLLGIGGKVSYLNLHITLLLVIGTQLSLCLLNYRSVFVQSIEMSFLDARGERVCRTDKISVLLSQSYLLCLLVLGTVIASVNHSLKRNYNESRWLFLASCISLPVLIAWGAITFLSTPPLETPTSCIAYIMLASIIIGVIFFPKLRVISEQNKEFGHKRMRGSPSISTVFVPNELFSQHIDPSIAEPFNMYHHSVMPKPNDVFAIQSRGTDFDSRSSRTFSTRSSHSSIKNQNTCRNGCFQTFKFTSKNPIFHGSKNAYP